MEYLDDYFQRLERENIRNFPTYSDFNRWYQLKEERLSTLKTTYANGKYDETLSTAALQLWREFQAFYLGFKFMEEDLIPFMGVYDAYKNILLTHIFEIGSVVDDVKYVEDATEVDEVLNAFMEIYCSQTESLTFIEAKKALLEMVTDHNQQEMVRDFSEFLKNTA